MSVITGETGLGAREAHLGSIRTIPILDVVTSGVSLLFIGCSSSRLVEPNLGFDVRHAVFPRAIAKPQLSRLKS